MKHWFGLRHSCAFATLLFATVVTLTAAPAWALRQRTFVAADPLGNDANAAVDCTLAQPCRTFNVAIAHTTPGGEVVILDTAGYGPMTINKSIKIIGPSGVYGGISVLRAAAAQTHRHRDQCRPHRRHHAARSRHLRRVRAAPPLPLIGIDIQNAGAVHIEKSSISNFTQPTGACIKAAPTAPVIVYVDDSMLRECRTGINANGTAESADGDLVVFVDNTRIELSYATSGPAYGLWVQGFAAATMRNSVISVSDVGIQFNNIATNGTPILVLSQTQVLGGGTCLNVASASAGGIPMVYIDGSQFLGCDDGIVFSHTATPTAFGAQLKITDSKFEHLNNGAITLSTGADAGVNVDLVRSQLTFTGNTGISLAAGGTSGISLNIRDSTLSNALTLLKTSGTSGINATLIRSHLHNSLIGGRPRAGSHTHGADERLGQPEEPGEQRQPQHRVGRYGTNGTNWIFDNVDAADGTVYITADDHSDEVDGESPSETQRTGNPSAFRSSSLHARMDSRAYVSTGSCTPNIASLTWKSLSRSSAARSNSRFFAASTISFSSRFSSFSMSFSAMDS